MIETRRLTEAARPLVLLVSLALVLGLVAACGGGGSSSSAGGTPAQSGKPVRGGVLRFARSQEPQSLDPVGVADNGSLYTRLQIYDTLVRANPDPSGPAVVPGLATRWDTSADGLTWTFHLRNARFADGSAVTAADVRFSLGRFTDPKINTGLSALAFGIDKITAPNRTTAVVSLKHPVGALLENLSVAVASIVPEKLVSAQGKDFWSKPIGSGPFRVKEWVRGSHLILERNPYYWGKGLPYLDGVRFDFLPDNNARVLKIQGNGADIAEAVPYDQIPRLRQMSGVEVRVNPIPLWDAVFLNHRVKPLDDPKVRQALNYAIDKDALNAAVYGGVAKPANDMMPQVRFTAGPSEVPPYGFDLAKAKRLIAESSAPQGFSATFLFPAGSTGHKDVATILRDDWAKIGVKIKLEEVGASDLTSRYFGGRWQIAIPTPTFTSDVPVPDEVALLFYRPPPANPIGGFATGWKIPPRLWQLTQKFVESTKQSERRTLWPQIQRLTMREAPWVTLFFVPAVTGLRDNVHGFQVLPVGGWDLAHVWLG